MMGLLDWFNGKFTSRGRAIKLYKQGMSYARRREHEAAVESYSECLKSPDVPPDVVAMALYNRSLSLLACNKEADSASDLKTVIDMKGVPEGIKAEARQRVQRLKKRNLKPEPG